MQRHGEPVWLQPLSSLLTTWACCPSPRLAPEQPPSEKLRALPRVHAWFHRAEQRPLCDWTWDLLTDQLCCEARPSRIWAPQTSRPLAPFRRFGHCVLGSSFHHRNCETGDTFTATNCSETLGAIAFHRDWCANGTRKSFSHFVTPWRQLWPLAHHSSVDVAWFKS